MRAFFLVLLLGLAGCATNPLVWVHDFTHHLTMKFDEGAGSCSGTAVGPHAILTAEHCLAHAEALYVDGKPVAVKGLMLDGDDHAIVLVDATFEHYAIVGREPGQGAEVFIVGNPGMLNDQYRHGYITGYTVQQNRKWTLYDINGWYGDSGSGIFDDDGVLIGVISIEYSQLDGDAYMKVMGSLPLAFTPDQWAKAHG